MSGIGTEIRVFCYAILTGVLIVAVYLWIRVLRRLVAHRLWLINLEDACYWAGISVYTFVQIYHTSDGVLRWYIGLGIALGSIGMALLSAVFVRAYKKISTRICEKRVKRVRFSKGHALIWRSMSMVRDIEFTKIEPVHFSEMTRNTWDANPATENA